MLCIYEYTCIHVSGSTHIYMFIHIYVYVYACVIVHAYMIIYIHACTEINLCSYTIHTHARMYDTCGKVFAYGVALVSRIDKIIGLFCKRAL